MLAWLALSSCGDRILAPMRAVLDRVQVAVDSVAGRLVEQGSTAYRLDRSAEEARFSSSAYAVTVRFGHPFGLTSVRLSGQPMDFAHPTLPLGDWEWFWFDAEEGRLSAKLIDPGWEPPAIERRLGQAVLRFARPDVLKPGIGLSVAYRLSAAAGFEAEYGVDNRSGQRLANPYAMVGFPGFSDHAWVTEVATALQARAPRPPSTTFLAEALADGRSDYLLLRHDVDLRADPRILEGRITERAGDRRYSLIASCLPGPGIVAIYSAHTNKPGYLTSHLYVFFSDMEDGERHQVLVRYRLAAE